MIRCRLTLFAVLIFFLTSLPAFSYANEAGVGDSIGAGQEHNMMDMPGHDMSGHAMETPGSNMPGQSPGAAGTQQTTDNIPDQADAPAPDGTDMSGHNHNMGGTGPDTAANQPSDQNIDRSGQNPQANDATDTSAGDMSDQDMNGSDHEMPAGHSAHDLMNMPEHSGSAVQDSSDHQSTGHDGSTVHSPSAKEVNRAGLLVGFGVVDGLIVLAAVILKRKTKVGGAV